MKIVQVLVIAKPVKLQNTEYQYLTAIVKISITITIPNVLLVTLPVKDVKVVLMFARNVKISML